MENKILMKQAREALSGKWLLAIGTSFVYYLIVGVPAVILNKSTSEGVGNLLQFFIAPPFSLGMVIFSLSIARDEEASFGQLFEGFSDYWRTFVTYILVAIFTLLWMLLLIIPGIIKSISYSMTFYILADDKTIGAREAISKSQEMMDGYKWKYFRLQLRFIGLALLCILTLGIGFLWLFPYIFVTTAKFYEDVKGNVTDRDN